MDNPGGLDTESQNFLSHDTLTHKFEQSAHNTLLFNSPEKVVKLGEGVDREYVFQMAIAHIAIPLYQNY